MDVAKLQDSNKRLFERAKKAEAEAKALRAVKPVPAKVSTQQASPAVDVDERVLKANGMNDELLTQLKDIATLRKVSLIDAQKDPLFVAVKAEFEKTEKSKKASLGSSRGSGAYTPPKDINTPGLKRDEHREMFNKRIKG